MSNAAPSSSMKRVKGTGRGLQALALTTLVASFALVILGGVVRVTDSGLGCPDWPLCHGRIIPPFHLTTLIEYSHRLVATAVGVLVLTTAFVVWRSYRRERWLLVPATLGLALVGAQVVLGGVTVLTELASGIVLAHLAVAQALMACMVVVYVVARRGVGKPETQQKREWRKDRFAFLALGTVLATYVLLLSGSYVTTSGASSACGEWPLCQGHLLPEGRPPIVHMAHRFVAALVGMLIVATVVAAWRRRRREPGLGGMALVGGSLFLIQVFVGAANVWLGLPAAAKALHLALATAVWMALAALAVLAYTTQRAPASSSSRVAALSPRATPVASPRSTFAILSDYLALTKPPIVVLLLVTALGGMLLAAGGLPALGVLVAVMVGGALAAGGAGAINHYLDRDIDERMNRTRRRPVAGHRISPRNALTFGVVLSVLAFGVLILWTNLLSALLTLGGALFYIFVYTRWLKRATPQNIVVGGAAGAVPPLVGWAAVTGSLGLPAFYLFAIIFFWTPPHFWALSLLIKGDYARAGVPMLPVVRGLGPTKRDILLYTMVLVAITLLFFTIQAVGWLYFAVALGLGTLFLFLAWRLLRSDGIRGARPLYHYSLLYLALIFVVIMVDSTLGL